MLITLVFVQNTVYHDKVPNDNRGIRSKRRQNMSWTEKINKPGSFNPQTTLKPYLDAVSLPITEAANSEQWREAA